MISIELQFHISKIFKQNVELYRMTLLFILFE